MTIDAARIARVIEAAAGRAVLLETEGLELLDALGISAPAHLFVRNAAEAAAADTSALGGDRVVVKVDLAAHPPQERRRRREGRRAAAGRDRGRRRRHGAEARRRRSIVGFTINEFLRYDTSIGHELILGLRWTEDFGPVVTLGAGGIYTEFLAEAFKPGPRDRRLLARRSRPTGRSRRRSIGSRSGGSPRDDCGDRSRASRRRRSWPPCGGSWRSPRRSRPTPSPSARSTRWSSPAGAWSRSTSW